MQWKRALPFALAILFLVLGLFYYWFGIADRYLIFLYNHDMGPLVPDTSPFSAVTSSRYWMAGLVASGVILALYLMGNWFAGRLMTSYQAPAWWLVWVLCAPPLLLGLPLITMTLNHPTLPLANALQVTLAALVGLALALIPGDMAAQKPGELLWLALDGCGLMLILLALIGIEHLPRWLASGGTGWILYMIVVLLVALLWLLLVTGVLYLLRIPVPSAAKLLLAGFCTAYLLMPLVHHVVGTNGYFYITDSANFFADSLIVQGIVWLAVGMLAWALGHLRQTLAARGTVAPGQAA
jgi:hypothetical protein